MKKRFIPTIIKRYKPRYTILTYIPMLYIFFWVIPQRLNCIYRRFGALCLFHLHRQVGEELLNLRILEVFIWEKVCFENSLS